ncbi:Uncharacterised protein [Zhongshania aliphaticivorans]|uniref:Prepilin type IV endopeptidase peptidase domain-containing protein n=1 Tax=Zhongshania aliphaticivorans TaxID=1470434 RepID=A0A5S9QC70_9GAMM|nr:A24 family peptidase [Zhongshania aliphaticivorans]CAA0088049.1 Uncharacterised protein [Zhongshania aliphaticivorans]CAA0115843.1 Uncharacterised protein [Zhongshania aliphaticivorans]CAA0120324.1 Uncharacterised protein [Zhongshania aliphaticivorans]
MCSLPLLLIIGYIDWRNRRIPNNWVVILFGWAVFYTALSPEINLKLIGLNLVIGLALTLPGYVKGIVGAGDVKLMIAISPLWQPTQLLWVFSLGIISLLFLMSLQHYILKMPLIKTYYPDSQTSNTAFHRGVPLGSAIAIGATLVTLLKI